jgi:serine/threonine-protein kinase
MSNGALFAIAFDPNALETHGTAVSLLNDVQFAANTGAANLSVSHSGTLVYRKGGRVGLGFGPRARIDWIDNAGRRSPLLSVPERFSRPRFSPDGKKLAVVIGDIDGRDYWVYDLQRNTRNKITFGGLNVSTVVWTDDSRHLFVGAGAGGDADKIGIYSTAADGASQPTRILAGRGGVVFPTSYSAVTKSLLYAPFQRDILTLPVTQKAGQWEAAGEPAPFIQTGFSEGMAVFSPDGRWVAYSTDESKRLEVNVRAFELPASGQPRRWTISTNGGTRPVWSKGELLYQEGDRIMAVRYTVNGNEFRPQTPQVRVEKLGAGPDEWDLAPNGRIAVVTPIVGDAKAGPDAPQPDHSVVFVQNFVDEVRRRVK